MVSAMEARRRVLMQQPHRATATGAIASFRTDIVSALPMEFDLVPIQDLHGQANPYPPGGGKNLFGGQWPPSVSGTYAGWEMPATTYCRLALYDKGNNADISGVYFGMSEDGTSTPVTWIVTNGSLYEPTYNPTNNCYAIGYSNRKYVTIYPATQEALTKIMNRFNVYCFVDDTNQTWTYSPYSNICPITGHDGFTRVRTGKNLFDESIFADYGGVLQADGMWKFNGLIQILGKVIYTPPDGYTGQLTIIFARKTDADRQSLRFYINYTDGTSERIGTTLATGGVDVYTLTTNASKVVKNITGDYGSNLVTYANLMVSIPGTATVYEPYTGHSYTTTFPTPPGTVYGGHVTDNGDGTGTLVVDRVKLEYTTLQNVASHSSGYRYWVIDSNSAEHKNVTSYNTSPENKSLFSSNMFVGNVGVVPGNFYATGNGVILVVVPYQDQQSIDNKDDAIAWLTNNPLELVLPLATPQTYTLSMTALQSLIGQNHIWVDNADSVSVEYWGH